MFDADIGKLMVGAYLREVEGCSVVSYNPGSEESTERTSALVAGKKVVDEEETVYLCEVFTSVNTIKLQGRPEGERWSDFGDDNTQYTLEQLWSKFRSSYELALTNFGGADHIIFQLWAPKVWSENMMNGLVQLAKEFKEEYGLGIGLIINEEYTSRMAEFVESISDETDGPSERALKVVQSINDLQADME